MTPSCAADDPRGVEGPNELATVFMASLPPGVRDAEVELNAALCALFEAGRAAWPGVALDGATFARYLAGHTTPPEATLPSPELAADLHIACACARSAPGAAAALERHFGPAITRALARIDASPAFVADARQTVFVQVLVPSAGAAPKIAEYAGRAPLQAFLRTVAVRVALNLRRNKADQAHEILDEGDGTALATGADPELGYVKARYKGDFEAAVRAAVARLSSRDRTLLRLHLVDGLSIDVLGAHYQVGRSTAARWLARAREALRDHARAEITARLQLTPSELASLAGTLRSQLEVSATSLLREDKGL